MALPIPVVWSDTCLRHPGECGPWLGMAIEGDELPARAKQAMGKSKRDRQFDRTLRYIEELGAAYVFPTAGPPCFLDEVYLFLGVSAVGRSPLRRHARTGPPRRARSALRVLIERGGTVAC